MNNKKYHTLKTCLYFSVFILGFGRFLPVIYAPEFLQDFFSKYGIFLHLPAMLLLFGLFVHNFTLKTARWLSVFLVVLYVVCWFSTSLFQEANNYIIIWWNSGKKIENFSSPILGMKKNLRFKDKGRIEFHFNGSFLVYEALVYEPDHGLDESDYEFQHDDVFKKVYNADWWWYNHID